MRKSIRFNGLEPFGEDNVLEIGGTGKHISCYGVLLHLTPLELSRILALGCNLSTADVKGGETLGDCRLDGIDVITI